MKEYSHLSLEQRYQIEALLKAGHSQSEIAHQLGVHKSTVSRELKRNGQWQLRGEVYKGGFAQLLCEKRRESKPVRFKAEAAVCRRIVWLLRRGWSPEQIAKVCAKRHIAMLSVEAIYLWVYEQKKQGFDLSGYLRRRHRKRRKRALCKQPRSVIKNKKSIEQRPQAVEKQERIGDFELDLAKCQNGYLVVATERKTLLNLICKIPNKSAIEVQKATINMFKSYQNILHTITSDNGTEFAYHQTIAQSLAINWYFAHPSAPYERGANENQIGLIRQFFPRKTNLHQISDQLILDVQNQLNSRPRKKLNFETPKFLFDNLSVALES